MRSMMHERECYIFGLNRRLVKYCCCWEKNVEIGTPSFFSPPSKIDTAD